MTQSWDYLVLTASDSRQARAFENALELRSRLGLLTDVKRWLVVPDPEGRRIGSGGSTLLCLREILDRELPVTERHDRHAWYAAFERLRVLILHAGGDSRRLPAYAPVGKCFVPLPGAADSAAPACLFDRQLAALGSLPAQTAIGSGRHDRGQFVIACGDVLLEFDATGLTPFPPGVTGLGAFAGPDEASRHGVYLASSAGVVATYCQKPSESRLRQMGMLDSDGRAVLDIGVISFDSQAAVTLLGALGATVDESRAWNWSGRCADAMHAHGLDFFREFCCAWGTQQDLGSYLESVVASGSRWPEEQLRELFVAIGSLPFHLAMPAGCVFRHLGTTRQLVEFGEHTTADSATTDARCGSTQVNCLLQDSGELYGGHAWVEGCTIGAPVRFGGDNLLAGVEVRKPLSLPVGACLDVVQGTDRAGRQVHFVRCYGVNDLFHGAAAEAATFCGMALREWLRCVGATDDAVWDGPAPSARTDWNARLFPAVSSSAEFAAWLWMLDAPAATDAQRRAWREAERYSLAEISCLVDHHALTTHRLRLRALQIAQSVPRLFSAESGFSAADLAVVLENHPAPEQVVSGILAEARRRAAAASHSPHEVFAVPRILHSLGSALERRSAGGATGSAVVSVLFSCVDPELLEWFRFCCGLETDELLSAWAGKRLQDAAFDLSRRAIVRSLPTAESCRNHLRPDEIVWARAPVRLDLGGGWTDTPPYALEFGGSVVNAAVDLNGQPPIHVYARVIGEPLLRITSVDQGERLEIRESGELRALDNPASTFALVRAALAQVGFGGSESAPSLRRQLEEFGGGLELTTLAALPKGSGLGTSSIMGSAVLAALHRVLGRQPSREELFNATLCLEQTLTTGGGWQDQVGGVIGGVKLTVSTAGLTPQFDSRMLAARLLSPVDNGGVTLLYYTGITRLAKNILERVVGRYLDRDRTAMATLQRLRELPERIAAALAQDDLHAFGRLIDESWRLNKSLDPDSTTPQVEEILRRVGPHICGAKLLGAGGGGFLLLVCRSPADAGAVINLLTADPPNDRARFFDFSINEQGLSVTAC
jgi:fucokinase